MSKREFDGEALPDGVYRRPKWKPSAAEVFRRLKSWKTRSVTSRKRSKLPWLVYLKVGGRLHFVGAYESVEAASRAHDEALYLLSDAEVIPWYLRFNDPTSFLTPFETALLPVAQVQITCDKVKAWFARHFGDAQQRIAARAYYLARNIPLTREKIAVSPFRSRSVVTVRGLKPKQPSKARGPRGKYKPRATPQDDYAI